MPVYMNGKKIKDLHYVGKKLKEAWFEGKKVYSSAPPQWAVGMQYNQGDTVTWGNGRQFRCLFDHTSGEKDTQPIWGNMWNIFWEEIT